MLKSNLEVNSIKLKPLLSRAPTESVSGASATSSDITSQVTTELRNIVDQIDNVFVGHNRLSIQDLSSAANQPMWNEDKTVCIVYNGELWDSIETNELKKGLNPEETAKLPGKVICTLVCIKFLKIAFL